MRKRILSCFMSLLATLLAVCYLPAMEGGLGAALDVICQGWKACKDSQFQQKEALRAN